VRPRSRRADVRPGRGGGQAGQLVMMSKMVEVLLLLQQLRLNLAPDRHVIHGEQSGPVRRQIEAMTAGLDVEETSVLAALPHLERHARIGIPKFSQERLGIFALVRATLGTGRVSAALPGRTGGCAAGPHWASRTLRVAASAMSMPLGACSKAARQASASNFSLGVQPADLRPDPWGRAG